MNPRKSPRTRTTSLSLVLSLLFSPFAAHAASGRRTAPQNPAVPGQTSAPQRPGRRQPAPPAGPQPTPAPQDEGDDVVRITANLVQLDVTVTDRQGRPVTDLRPEDFEVVVDGRAQAVTELSFVSTDEGLMTTERAPAAGVRSADPKAPPPPARLRPEQVRRTIALVADDLGASFESMYYVRQALKKFVDEQMRPGDLVAVMRTSAGMGALQQFTSDKRLLHRAIERVKWNPRGRAGIGAFAAIEADPLAEAREQAPNGRGREEERDRERERDLGREADEFREDIFAVGTLGALNFIVKGLKELPGRKSVIMFSDGFEIYRADGGSDRVRENLRRLVDLAGRSSVVINTVDARGLQVTGLTAADNTSGLSREQIERAVSDRSSRLFNTQAGLSYLAEETGGLSVRNNNDLPGAVRRALEAQKSYYLVGFRPDDTLFDQERGRVRFNRVEVRVRRAGLRARTRGGFYGFTEDEARPVLRTRREQMAAALFSPFAAGAVPLRLTSLFQSVSEKENSVASLLHIDVSGFRFEEEADGWRKAVLDVVALTFGENGQVLDEVNRTETVRARGEAFDALVRGGLVYTLRAPVKKPGAYQLRVVVRDAASEKVGSASQFIEVPDLKKERLALSGIVLSAPQDADAGTSVTAAGAKAPASAAGEDAKVTSGPAVRRFRRGAVFEYHYAIYNAKPDRATGRPRLTTQTRLFRDGRPVFTGGVTPYDAAGQTGVRRLPAGARLRLGSNLTPGEYLLQVVVTDELAKEKHRVATQWIDFEVVD